MLDTIFIAENVNELISIMLQANVGGEHELYESFANRIVLPILGRAE